MTSAAIAKRADLDGELVRFLARKGFLLVAETLVLNPRAAIDRETIAFLAPALAGARTGDAPGAPPRRRAGLARAVFLALDARARTGVVEAYRLDADARRTATRDSLIAPPPTVLDGLEFAALSRRPRMPSSAASPKCSGSAGLACGSSTTWAATPSRWLWSRSACRATRRPGS